jgi:ribosomal protein S18 acetylase RimI-like enzyme
MTIHDPSAPSHASLSDLRIRQVVRDDLHSLEWDGLFTHFRRVFWKSYVEQQLGDRHLLVAEINQRIVGRLFILHRRSQFKHPPAQRRGYLYSFYVLEGYRGFGIGTALLQAAEDHLRGLQIAVASISVARTNLAAKRLYQRHGYVITGEDSGEWSYLDHQGVLRKVTEPCYILEKNLKDL